MIDLSAPLLQMWRRLLYPMTWDSEMITTGLRKWAGKARKMMSQHGLMMRRLKKMEMNVWGQLDRFRVGKTPGQNQIADTTYEQAQYLETVTDVKLARVHPCCDSSERME